MKKDFEYTNRAKEYAGQVLSGEIVAPSEIKTACVNFFTDLKRKDLEYRNTEVQKFGLWAEWCRLPAGQGNTKAGDKVKLFGWQCFALANIFGFYYKNGKRRYKEAFLLLPRRNGKSAFISLMMWYFVFFQNKNPSVYVTSSDQGQSEIVFDYASKLAEASGNFKTIYKVKCNSKPYHPRPEFYTNYRNSEGYLSTLIAGKNVHAKDGRPIHLAIFDDLQGAKSEEATTMIESMKQGMMGINNSLFLYITTAGDVEYPVAFKEFTKFADNIKEKKDDRLFSLLFQPDADDDLNTYETFCKVNPSASELIPKDDWEYTFNNTRRSSYYTKNLNKWIRGESSWLDAKKLDKSIESTRDFDDFIGYPISFGVDLSRSKDLTSYCMTAHVNGIYYSKWRHWLPRKEYKTNKNNKELYQSWVKQGLITVSKDEAIDFMDIRKQLHEDIEKYRPKAVLYDKMFAEVLFDEIKDKYSNIRVERFNQNTINYDLVMEQFEGILDNKKWTFDGDSVAHRCLLNVVAQEKKLGAKLYPGKNNDDKKIDAAVALLMSLGTFLHPYFMKDNKKVKRKRSHIYR